MLIHTLDSINIEKPLVAMKIDTEGHEYEVQNWY